MRQIQMAYELLIGLCISPNHVSRKVTETTSIDSLIYSGLEEQGHEYSLQESRYCKYRVSL